MGSTLLTGKTRRALLSLARTYAIVGDHISAARTYALCGIAFTAVAS